MVSPAPPLALHCIACPHAPLSSLRKYPYRDAHPLLLRPSACLSPRSDSSRRHPLRSDSPPPTSPLRVGGAWPLTTGVGTCASPRVPRTRSCTRHSTHIHQALMCEDQHPRSLPRFVLWSGPTRFPAVGSHNLHGTAPPRLYLDLSFRPKLTFLLLYTFSPFPPTDSPSPQKVSSTQHTVAQKQPEPSMELLSILAALTVLYDSTGKDGSPPLPPPAASPSHLPIL